MGHGDRQWPRPLQAQAPWRVGRGALVTASDRTAAMTRSYGDRPRTNTAASGHREQDRTREREALYRVLLLVRWRRRERQVVSGLRRKNTEHAHTHTHAHPSAPLPRPGTRRRRLGPAAPDGVHPSIWKTSVPTPALGRLPALPNSTEEARFSSRRTAKVISYRRRICH